MKELKGEDSPRPSELRIDEAWGARRDRLLRRRLSEGRDDVRGRDQDLGHQGEIELRELSELVWESVTVA